MKKGRAKREKRKTEGRTQVQTREQNEEETGISKKNEKYK